MLLPRPDPIFPLSSRRSLAYATRQRAPQVHLLLLHQIATSVNRPSQHRDVSTSQASVQPPDYLSESELKIFNKLNSELQPLRLDVKDISGGCGSMYGLDIVSSKFQGLSIIKQHQLVNRLLADEIKGWHGMQLKTKAP